jgi:hypothetical protein
MDRRRLIPRGFEGLNVNTPLEKIQSELFQVDLNGDRRRGKSWRVRSGYARFLAGSSGVSTYSADYSDDFNRANGDLGADWTDYGCTTRPPQIESNQVVATPSLGAVCVSLYTAAGAPPDDQASRIVVEAIGNQYAPPPVVVVRGSASGGYALAINVTNNTLRIWRMTDWGDCTNGSASGVIIGSYTTVGYGGAPIIRAGQELRLHVAGSTLQAFLDDAKLISVIDANIAAGTPGFGFFGGSITTPEWKLDDWEGGLVTETAETVSVNMAPRRMIAFERTDDEMRLVIANGDDVGAHAVDQFDTGVPEGI